MNKKEKRIYFIGSACIHLVQIIGLIIIFKHITNCIVIETMQQSILILIGIMLGIIIAMNFQIIIHELGHLIFGLLSGYKFVSFRIFSFILLKQDGKIKLKKLFVAGTAGQCLMSPPDIKNDKFPYILYHLGGCIMNAIISTIFLIIFLIWPENTFVSIIMLFMAVAGYICSITNAFPIRTKTVDNDGYNVLSILKKPETAKYFWIQMKAVEQNEQGVSIQDMPAEWFKVPSDIDMKNSTIAYCGVLVCDRLMEEKKYEEADKLIEHFLTIDSSINGHNRHLLICNRICIELIKNNRHEIIEKMLTEEQKNI